MSCAYRDPLARTTNKWISVFPLANLNHLAHLVVRDSKFHPLYCFRISSRQPAAHIRLEPGREIDNERISGRA